MKIYLIVEYKSEKKGVVQNFWADVRAFTSPRVRDAEFRKYPTSADVEPKDIEIEKREYCTKSPQVQEAQEAGVEV